MPIDTIDGDLLRGAPAIAKHLGLSVRTTYKLLDKGELPAFRFAGKWNARRSRLAEFFRELEATHPDQREAG